MIYGVAFWAQFQTLIPWLIRKPKHLAWLQSMLAPLQTLNAALVAYVTKLRYESTATGQVIFIEKLLNDRFDNSLRRIALYDGTVQTSPTVFNTSEVWQTTTTIWNRTESGTTAPTVWNLVESHQQIDCYVVIPTALNPKSDQIKALVSQYIMAGVRYKVQNGLPF